MTAPTGKFPTRITESQIHHHSSETARSPNPAGGEVPRSQYENRGPAPRSCNGTTTLEKAQRQ
jgi:hypothetical protein